MKHLGLKLFSLAIAIVLSYIVNGERNSSVVSFAASVELRNLPDSKVLIQPSRPEVQVTVRGPSFLVRPLPGASHSFIVRLPRGEVPDKFSAVLQQADLALPPSVEIMRIEPSQVDLRFDSMASKSVKVEVPRLGQLSTGLSLENISVKPEEIEIRGPKREIDVIRSVQTYPVDLRSVDKSSSLPSILRLPASVIGANNGEVVITVKVAAAFEEKRFDGCAVEVRSTPGVMAPEITPTNVDVVIRGPEKLIRSITEKQCTPYIRVLTNAPDASEADVKLDLPEGVLLDRTFPARVKLKAASGAAPARPVASTSKKNKR